MPETEYPPESINAAVIVAHPDDETLWAGGTILMHANWRWTVVALCRGSDPDRSPRFLRALERLGASGRMADLDDGPEQRPLPKAEVRKAVLSVLPMTDYDLILAHSPYGEYTRNLRHEETGRAVLALWETGKISARELWMFAYEDGGGRHLPRAVKGTHRKVVLPQGIWQKKHDTIEKTYGFGPYSFEARTTPREEAFWCFSSPAEVQEWIAGRGGKP